MSAQPNAEINSDLIRSYANILSKSTIEKMVRGNNYSYIRSKSKKYDQEFIQSSQPTFEEYLNHVFHVLKSNYRNEYIYKNAIITELLIKKFGLETTTALNEFKVNKSIADLVLLNGTSKVFEVKTELDNPKRLASQISDYKKVFQEVYIVTYHSILDKYVAITDDSIGIIALTDDLKLETKREPQINTEFDNTSILKCLRKPEYVKILKEYFGFIPETTDVKFFRTCKEFFAKIPPSVLHNLMLIELKKRRIKEEGHFLAGSTPEYLKHICYSLDLNQREYEKLTNILKRKI